MRLTSIFCVLCVAICGYGDLAPPPRPYNFLVLMPMSTESHRNVFAPLITALAGRGHKLTILSNLPDKFHLDNITEVDHGIKEFAEGFGNTFDDRRDPQAAFQRFTTIFPPLVAKLYANHKATELYRRRNEFDLIIIDAAINEVAYPFLHGQPFITVSTQAGVDWRQSAVLGNVLNPSYANSLLNEFPLPMTFLQRVGNLALQVIFPTYWRCWAIVPGVQEEVSKVFPDLPPLLELERNMSLALMNVHFSTNHPLPLLPSQVEVGGMHCRAALPLPQKLENWISGAGPDGVIYFSLGSITRGNAMPVEYRDLFVQAFARLKQRVIWKYEGELQVSDNVYLGKWLPQQDILGHPNVRLFISHCGGLSLEESIYHATPMLSVPIFGDQPRNAVYMQNNGFGEVLIWEELTVDHIVDSVEKMIADPKYHTAISEASEYSRDRPERPVDRAVYWTEYVIRHGGAPRLRTPARLLSWREYLMLDVLLLIQVLAYVAYRLTKCLLCCVYRKAVGAKQKPKLE